MKPDDPRHGTYAGAQRHSLDGEESCEPCRAARAAYMREHRKGAPVHKVRNAASSRARWRLVALHREEYERLYADELTKALGLPRPDAEIVREKAS